MKVKKKEKNNFLSFSNNIFLKDNLNLIKLNNVSFSYDKDNNNLLQNINLTHTHIITYYTYKLIL